MSEAQIAQRPEFLLIAFNLHDIKNVPILKMVEMGGGGGRPISVSFLNRTSAGSTMWGQNGSLPLLTPLLTPP